MNDQERRKELTHQMCAWSSTHLSEANTAKKLAQLVEPMEVQMADSQIMSL